MIVVHDPHGAQHYTKEVLFNGIVVLYLVKENMQNARKFIHHKLFRCTPSLTLTLNLLILYQLSHLDLQYVMCDLWTL
jgi:hypothetical protein